MGSAVQVVPWQTPFLIPIQSSMLLPLQALGSSPSSQQLGRENDVGGPHGPVGQEVAPFICIHIHLTRIQSHGSIQPQRL